MYGKTNNIKVSFNSPRAEENPLFAMARQCDLDTLRSHTWRLSDFDLQESSGMTLFMMLKRRYDQQILDFVYSIVKQDIASDTKGRTLLHWAAKCNQAKEELEACIQQGNSLNDANNPFHVTPLYMAAMEGNAQSLEALLALGADKTVCACNGATPLHAAAESGQLSGVNILIKAGAAINAQCQVGGTPLMAAVQRNRLDVARALIESGAEVNARLKDGGTALILAAQFGYAEIVQLLLENGADTEHTVQGKTALDAAKANRHQDVITLLSESFA